ncbi:DEAD/DEAH box helicase family protein [Limnoraphis robusta Tam1]|uniref:DEAD/DEAH box helicase family protein n=1 Tax=Limnoraphis robusta CCNP1315 TaxID=3110306 RepID=A0ABU5TRM1_9CYAN|nr:DEAD/DEAH box helicase family protein [Limnoraphis robusta]MEA5497937.1 DEAD/DEAH box helicase family protein [Limnoraphis robusta BA-68 BA1]MEA5517365.1 DEAD/DEAH box helicase family protein [Limnoraphis robusta CCNP1315]MEA5542957.1 DEAD/DEAH box helicase family protein [Limnoraphis robusta Tam1]MEA5546046.1 DEAD/DEAH box helicase family protein [Limnoraphis robusta CCNP1324]
MSEDINEDGQLNEAETIAKLINPALYKKGWTEEFIKREVTAPIRIIDGVARKQKKGRADIVLRLMPGSNKQLVAASVVEAKAEKYSPSTGLEQAKKYAKRLHVPFVYSTNGHRFVEFDRIEGTISNFKPLSEFPAQGTIRTRYEKWVGFKLDDPVAQPLLTPYTGGDSAVRYYQDAAIRAVLEKIARCEKEGTPKRALLSLATGSGKTRIAVHLMKRIADSGQRVKALFVCDRVELRQQASTAFQNVFGANAAVVTSREPQKNAQILIATYQTLGVEDNDDASFLTRNYPENYFSHIIIDECHRSAWGKWSIILRRNPQAVQIGLTATPRIIEVAEQTEEVIEDERITTNNIEHFGEPVYEYDMLQGVEDGYLAACEIIERGVKLNFDQLSVDDILTNNPKDVDTGLPIAEAEVRQIFQRGKIKSRIFLPNFEQRRCEDLFSYLLETGGAEQKTIIFCMSDRHADLITKNMNNLYVEWCKQNNQNRVEDYAFKCTDKGGGQDLIPDFRGSSRSHFIATTVDLLTTGVDVPVVRNIVFFNYINSPITFYQMVGRGTRLAEGKLMFRVYDYTDATRLFGEEFLTKLRTPSRSSRSSNSQVNAVAIEIDDPSNWVEETAGGRFMRAKVDGEDARISVEEYKERIAAKLVELVPGLDAFRTCWTNPTTRKELLNKLVNSGVSPTEYSVVEELGDYDLYDVLADIGYGVAPRTKKERAIAFIYKQADWLSSMPEATVKTVEKLLDQFAQGGIEALENPSIWDLVGRQKAITTLKVLGKPFDILTQIKEKIFSK